ncbi:MAG: RDD family protein [Phycisphaerales bacterium]|nr:RDD family protein [Hyphomonadaceae bacterium]
MTAAAVEALALEYERSRDTQAWARWFARAADALMLTPFVFVAFAMLGVLVELGRAPVEIYGWIEQPIVAGIMELGMMFVLFALWDPLFISNTGTTPGKWIMGVRVRRADGSKLSFFRALNRFVRVWFIGMGAGVPLLTLILMLISRAKLVSDGVTAWDEQLNCKVEHRKRHPALWVLVIVVVLVVNLGLRILSELPA